MNNEQLRNLRFEWSDTSNPWHIPARHILSLVYHQERWLVTRDYSRGIEFPGGKLEKGETLKEAVIRETWEETGVVVKHPKYVGEFTIFAERPFCKAVYVSTYECLKERPKEFQQETSGAIWLTTEEVMTHPEVSVHMTIDALHEVMKKVIAHDKK